MTKPAASEYRKQNMVWEYADGKHGEMYAKFEVEKALAELLAESAQQKEQIERLRAVIEFAAESLAEFCTEQSIHGGAAEVQRSQRPRGLQHKAMKSKRRPIRFPAQQTFLVEFTLMPRPKNKEYDNKLTIDDVKDMLCTVSPHVSPAENRDLQVTAVCDTEKIVFSPWMEKQIRDRIKWQLDKREEVRKRRKPMSTAEERLTAYADALNWVLRQAELKPELGVYS